MKKHVLLAATLAALSVAAPGVYAAPPEGQSSAKQRKAVDEEALLEEADRGIDEMARELHEKRSRGIGLTKVITQERINAHKVNDGLRAKLALAAAKELNEGALFKNRLRKGFAIDHKLSTNDLASMLQDRFLSDVYICGREDPNRCSIASGSEVSADQMTEQQCLDYGVVPEMQQGEPKEIRVLEKEKRLYIKVHAIDSRKASHMFSVWDAYRTRCYHFDLAPDDPQEIEALARAITW